MQERIRAAYYRGGTSKAVVFNGADLPEDKDLRDRLFLYIMGSPDPYGRQLDGMGGGLSSLSKVVIVEPSLRDDADVDYTFVQVAVDRPSADYGSACGNMSSCVGPFAVDEGLVSVDANQDKALVRIFNTNTSAIYHATFEVKNGKAVETGDFAIAGVAGTGARIDLDFLSPGGAITGKLLPTGNPIDLLQIKGFGPIESSMIDAANPVIFIRAQDVDRTAIEAPTDLDGDTAFMALMAQIRKAGAVAMGMADHENNVPASNPKIAMISAPQRFEALDGTNYPSASHDINVRLISMGNFHRAITLTGGMCAAVAANIEGTLVEQIIGATSKQIRIGNPSGVLPVSAKVTQQDGGPEAVSASTFRTQRRLMEGAVLFPTQILKV